MATRPTPHVVHKVLHRPMRLFGIDAQWWVLNFLVAVAVLNIVAQVPVALLVFLVGYGAAWVLTRREPKMLAILRRRVTRRQGWHVPRQYDPLRHDLVVIEVHR